MFPNQLILCIICLIFSSVHTEKVSIKYKMLDETNRLLKDSHAKKINPFITNTLSKVLLLAVEGLTPSLLSRVATPALDRLASRGSLSRSSWLKKKHHHHHQGKPRFGASYMILATHQVGAWVPLRDSAHPGSHCHRPAHWGWSGSHRGSTWWLLQVTGILDTEVWQDEQTLQPADPEFWAANNLTTLWVFTPWELLISMTKLYLAGSCQFSSWRQSWNSSMAWSRVWLWGEAKPFEVEPFAGHLKILQNNNKGSWNVLLNDAF